MRLSANRSYFNPHFPLPQQTTGQWQIVFLISSFFLFFCGFAFIFFGDAQTQPWNQPKGESEKKADEIARDKSGKEILIEMSDDAAAK